MECICYKISELVMCFGAGWSVDQPTRDSEVIVFWRTLNGE